MNSDVVYTPPKTPEEFAALQENWNKPFVEGITYGDAQMMHQYHEENREKCDLELALKSRVLTDEEMGRVGSLGIMLYIQNYWIIGGGFSMGRPHLDRDLNKRLNEDLLQQFRLRGEAARLAKDAQ